MGIIMQINLVDSQSSGLLDYIISIVGDTVVLSIQGNILSADTADPDIEAKIQAAVTAFYSDSVKSALAAKEKIAELKAQQSALDILSIAPLRAVMCDSADATDIASLKAINSQYLALTAQIAALTPTS